MARERFNPTIAAAMQEAIEASGGSVRTRRDYAVLANLFIAWLDEARAGVKTWADVTVKILQGYLRHCQETLRLSHDQTRKRLYIVKATSRYLGDTYGLPDVARTVRMKREQVNPLAQREAEARKALSASDLLAFLEHLARNRPQFYPIACLQGLCGLRAMEAANLREQDVDFSSGTVTVTETPYHKPKNRPSFRTIPVGPRVLAVLREWIASLKVRRADGCLFATERRNAPWSASGYSQAMRQELLACWRETRIETLRHFQPHWLRATFVSLCRAKRADHRLLQAYIGHAPSDVLGRHYEVIDVALLRAEIVPISEGIWHKVGTAKKSSAIE